MEIEDLTIINSKEIFLASGKGKGPKGVSNVNPLEAIVGKRNVFCLSKDERNSPPSKEEGAQSAHYFFRRIFDVDKRKTSAIFPDQIWGVTVEKLFKWRKQQSLTRKDQARPSNVPSNLQTKPSSKIISKLKESEHQAHPELRDRAGQSNVPSNSQLDKVVSNPPMTDEPSSKEVPTVEVKRIAMDPLLPPDTYPYKKMRTADSKPPEIFWEDRLQGAEGNNTLVLLQNLDPSYASFEVQGLVLAALNQKIEAKMIACTPFSNPRYGKALVIFKSSDDAEFAVRELNRRCLILSDGRPVIGTILREILKDSDKTSGFFGHLTIDRHRIKAQREEMRKAVATSHFAQANTAEYDMAMDWCLLQEKSELWWKAVYQGHEELPFIF